MADFNLGPYRPKPRGEFNSTTPYKYLDIVAYNGGSYICCNLDTIDGDAVIGVLPTGETRSEIYWQCVGAKGEKGDIGEEYLGFKTITDGIWDFSQTDKILIPDSATTDRINIINVYNGCCGLIITKKILNLPSNSNYALDYNYITANSNQYYLYTFIYGATPFNSNNRFIWKRTVINN